MIAPLLLAGASAETRHALERDIGGLGLSVQQTHSGTETLEYVMEKDFALILVPPSLTDMSGLELASLIHGDHSKRHMPLAMLTSEKVWEDIVYRAHEAGVVEHFALPFQRGILRGKLRLYSQLYANHQRLREQAQLLEASNQQFQEFAYAAAHDLRAPLRTISGLAGRLAGTKEDAAQAPNSPWRRDIDAIRRGADRMGALVHDMLAYAKSGTGRRDEAVSLEECVQEVISDLHEELTHVGAVVEVGALPEITGNSVQLRQVFQNIVANAIKYRRPNVRPLVKIRGSLSGGFLRLDIEDNGTGFDPECEEDLFRPFRRLVPSEDGGSGIGLATSKRIVERHGGTLGATGVPGEGSVFHVRLPMSAKEIGAYRSMAGPDGDVGSFGPMVRHLSAAPPDTPTRPGEAEKPRSTLVSAPHILLVDDDKMDSEFIRMALDQNLPVAVADSVNKALSMLSEHVVIVVSDYNMPGRSGLWLMTQVKKRRPGIHRVLLSGAPDQACQNALEEGVVHHLFEKSSDIGPLEETLKQVWAKTQ